MMRSVFVDLPEPFQRPESFVASAGPPQTVSIRKPLELTDAGNKDGWQLYRLPWDVSANEDMVTWSSDGQFFYLITSEPPADLGSPQRPFPKGFGDTVRFIHSSLLEGYATKFPESINFVGLSSEGLVVRYQRWQRLALLDPRTLKWIKDIGIPSPTHLTTSNASNRVWTLNANGLREYELPSGRPCRSYTQRELAEMVRAANYAHVPPQEISSLYVSKQSPLLKLSPDGKTLYLGFLGICKFDVSGESIRLVDCSGPSRDDKVFQPIYLSPDGSMVGKIGCASNRKGSFVGKNSGGTVVVSTEDLGELKLDATMSRHHKGFAFDPSTRTLFLAGSQNVLIRPELLEEPIEVPTPVHSLNSAILSASPHGAGALAVFVNEPFWIRQIPADTLAR